MYIACPIFNILFIDLYFAMEYNADSTGDKFKYIAQAMGTDTKGMTPEQYRKTAVDAVRKLSVDVGIPQKLNEIRVKKENIDALAESASKNVCTPLLYAMPVKVSVFSETALNRNPGMF